MQALAFRTVSVFVSVLALAACGESERRRDDDDSAGAPAGGEGAGQNAGGRGSAPGGQAGSGAGRGGASGGTAGTAGTAGASGRATGGVGGALSGGAGGAGESGAGAGGVAAGAAGFGAGGAAGAGASNGGAAGSAGDALEALRETVRAFCAAAATCCAEHDIPVMLEDCESAGPAHPESLAGLESGAVTVDMTALGRCRDAYGSADACNLNAVVAACEGVFIGHRQVGEACTGGYDCDRANAQMSCMYAASTDEPGVCKEIVRPGLDEPCFSSCRAGEDCSGSTIGTTEPVAFCYEDDGLYCEFLETGSVCRSLVPVGAPCGGFSFDACGSRAHCNETCVALSDHGEPCGPGCISRFTCEDGICTDPTWAREHTCSGELFLP